MKMWVSPVFHLKKIDLNSPRVLSSDRFSSFWKLLQDDGAAYLKAFFAQFWSNSWDQHLQCFLRVKTILTLTSTHILTQRRREQPKNRFVYKNQPMWASADIQWWAFSSGMQNTVMNVSSTTSDKMQSTMIYSIQLLEALISCICKEQITDQNL